MFNDKVMKNLHQQARALGVPQQYVPALNKKMLEKIGDGEFQYKRAFDASLRDTVRYTGAAAIPSQPFDLFAVVSGQQAKAINDPNVVYQKNPTHTNVQTARRIPYQELWVFSIQVFLVSLGTSRGTSTDKTVTQAIVNTGAPPPAFSEELMILRAGVLTNDYGSGTIEEDVLTAFPSEYGISGVAGNGDTTAKTYESVAVNGFGRAKILSLGHILDETQTLQSKITFYGNIVPSAANDIEIRYQGIAFNRVG